MQEARDSSGFHYAKPDYSRHVLTLSDSDTEKLKKRFNSLYGKEKTEKWFAELERILKVYYAYKSEEMIAWESGQTPQQRFTENDIILITYGDLVSSKEEKPLETMSEICSDYLDGVFNILHILPFFPYSSDRGFSIMDFEEVDPALGTWQDILNLKKQFKLMFDGVFNHVSAQSRWFQEFLNQNPDYTGFFTVFSTKEQISADHLKLIIRPRTSEVLTPFKTLNGPRLVWTTFSEDQIDLDYHNPKVLIKMIEIMLFYIIKGADLLRLDAVTYLWEELGTSCAHLEQTHETIKLFRDILDIVAPQVALITETNVPHKDNVRYFGNGQDEAQMVYNFALPPLVLHTFQNEDASKLTAWAQNLERVSDTATYFNFLDSHDGIGVMAVKDLLTTDEIENMALKVIENGGYISYKDNGDGTSSPYELNTTWFSALNNEDHNEAIDIQIDRYLASRSVALVITGVPGVYFHGLLGSKNDAELVIKEKSTRSINRKNFDKLDFIQSIEDESKHTASVSQKLMNLIRIRKQEPAFHPNGAQRVFHLSEKNFSLMRSSVDNAEHILTLVNITSKDQQLIISLNDYEISFDSGRDILTGTKYEAVEGEVEFNLTPYQIIWLKWANPAASRR